MLKNNFRLLDMDEGDRKVREKQMKKLIEACKVLNLTLNCATSDVVVFVENNKTESICIG
jgi:hypothetical protein